MKYITLIAITYFCFGCSMEKKESQTPAQIVIAGSNTVFPIVKTITDKYIVDNKNISFQIYSAGSNTGFEKLKTNQTDITTSSRQIKEQELLFFKEKNIEIKEEVIAYDALAIITHPSNPVSKLKIDQLEKIVTGEINNWKELNGKDQPIVFIRRDGDKSGTDEFFNNFILHGKQPGGNIIREVKNENIIKKIQSIPGSIAYMGYGYLGPGMKQLALQGINDKYFYPNKENIQNQLYPIIRPLFLYYRKEIKRKVYPFVRFILSEEGQKLVEKANYIPRKVIERSYLYLPPV